MVAPVLGIWAFILPNAAPARGPGGVWQLSPCTQWQLLSQLQGFGFAVILLWSSLSLLSIPESYAFCPKQLKCHHARNFPETQAELNAASSGLAELMWSFHFSITSVHASPQSHHDLLQHLPPCSEHRPSSTEDGTRLGTTAHLDSDPSSANYQSLVLGLNPLSMPPSLHLKSN